MSNYPTPSEIINYLSDLASINAELALPSPPSLADVPSNYATEDNFATAHFAHQAQQTASPLAFSLPLHWVNSVSDAIAAFSPHSSYTITDKQVPLATTSLRLFASNNANLNPSQAQGAGTEDRKRYQFFSQSPLSTLSSPPLPRSSLSGEAVRSTKKSKITP